MNATQLPPTTNDGRILEHGMYVSRADAGRMERYRDARSYEWSRMNALRWALRMEPRWTRIDLTDVSPFES